MGPAEYLPHGELLKNVRGGHPRVVLPKSRQLHAVQFFEEIRTIRGEIVAGVSSREGYRILIPSADKASSVPSSAVVLRLSSVGLTSTRSSAISRPDSAIISISRCASR